MVLLVLRMVAGMIRRLGRFRLVLWGLFLGNLAGPRGLLVQCRGLEVLVDFEIGSLRLWFLCLGLRTWISRDLAYGICFLEN
jgi:hypothetical protein